MPYKGRCREKCLMLPCLCILLFCCIRLFIHELPVIEGEIIQAERLGLKSELFYYNIKVQA